MTGLQLFDLYRKLLLIVFSTYGTVKLVNFVWRWQLATRRASRHEALLRRYLFLTLLRVRLRRFWLDALQILLLCVVLFGLVWVQTR
jgi:hypothetical protein